MSDGALTGRPLLQIIVASTRPGRVGEPVAAWFEQLARELDLFDIELIDLKEVDLPLLDEPNHPRLAQYTHDHTKAWSATVGRGDAFVFVTPEYNFSYGAALKNAFDYLLNEWRFKPVGFVAYGGVSAGTRALQGLKQVVSSPPMLPVGISVTIPFVGQSIVDGRFVSSDISDAAARDMVYELKRWIPASQVLRAQA